MSTKFKMNILAFAILVSFAGVLSSCYYDYGLDPNNSEIVATLYNNQYDFNAVTSYYLVPEVYHPDGSAQNQYDALILSTMKTNLNALNWTEATDSSNVAGKVMVRAAVTTGTTYIGGGYDYYYGWYYPPYYSYSYSYQTGTVLMTIADKNLAPSSAGSIEVQWTGALNAAINQGVSNNTLITTGINQAFSKAQSPYLH